MEQLEQNSLKIKTEEKQEGVRKDGTESAGWHSWNKEVTPEVLQHSLGQQGPIFIQVSNE